MTRTYLAILAAAAFGCAGGKSGATREYAPAEGLHRPQLAQSTTFGEIVDKLCRTFPSRNRANAEDWVSLHRELVAIDADAISSYVPQMLGDPLLAYCWPTATDVIGMIGSRRDVERSLDVFTAHTPGRWAIPDHNSALEVVGYRSLAYQGLSLAAVRFGPEDDVSRRIIEHLVACADLEYWRARDRVPSVRSEWYGDNSQMSAEDAVDSFVRRMSTKCRDYLGFTGSPGAARYLSSMKARTSNEGERRELDQVLALYARIKAVMAASSSPLGSSERALEAALELSRP